MDLGQIYEKASCSPGISNPRQAVQYILRVHHRSAWGLGPHLGSPPVEIQTVYIADPTACSHAATLCVESPPSQVKERVKLRKTLNLGRGPTSRCSCIRNEIVRPPRHSTVSILISLAKLSPLDDGEGRRLPQVYESPPLLPPFPSSLVRNFSHPFFFFDHESNYSLDCPSYNPVHLHLAYRCLIGRLAPAPVLNHCFKQLPISLPSLIWTRPTIEKSLRIQSPCKVNSAR